MMVPILLKVFWALSQGDMQVLMITAMFPSSDSSRPRLFYKRYSVHLPDIQIFIRDSQKRFSASSFFLSIN